MNFVPGTLAPSSCFHLEGGGRRKRKTLLVKVWRLSGLVLLPLTIWCLWRLIFFFLPHFLKKQNVAQNGKTLVVGDRRVLLECYISMSEFQWYGGGNTPSVKRQNNTTSENVYKTKQIRTGAGLKCSSPARSRPTGHTTLIQWQHNHNYNA